MRVSSASLTGSLGVKALGPTIRRLSISQMPPGSKQSRRLSSYLLESRDLLWHCRLPNPNVRLTAAQRAIGQDLRNHLGVVILVVLGLFAQAAPPSCPSSRLPWGLLLLRGGCGRKGRNQGEREQLIQAYHGGNQSLMTTKSHWRQSR
jgi:hypothetical protein